MQTTSFESSLIFQLYFIQRLKMKYYWKSLILFFAFIATANSKLFINPYPKLESHTGEISQEFGDDFGDPLYLTKLLKDPNRNLEEIRAKAFVNHTELKKFNSYSGYFTVNENYGSSLFFWYFKVRLS